MASDARPGGFPVVGMVGGGQLSRMTAQAAIPLGVTLRVLTRGVDDSAARVVHGPVLGDEKGLPDLRTFAAGCDVVTFDHEHVPPDVLAQLEADGVLLRPGPAALLHAQDKALMRERLTALGLPAPRWVRVATAADVAAFAEQVGWPVVLKATRGGYDGKGVWVVEDEAAAQSVVEQAAGRPLLAEEHVRLRRELAAVVARSAYGQGAAWPVVETVQRSGVCTEVIAPAPGLGPETAALAQDLALGLARDLGVTGVLAVELFETVDGRLLVNELAMRPHNSGHWTIEGSRTSQFEQHLRAVLDWPLGDTSPTAPVTVMANVLGGPDDDLAWRLRHVLAADRAAKPHLYGKAVRPGRKLGHVTCLGDDVEETRARAVRAASILSGAEQ